MSRTPHVLRSTPPSSPRSPSSYRSLRSHRRQMLLAGASVFALIVAQAVPAQAGRALDALGGQGGGVNAVSNAQAAAIAAAQNAAAAGVQSRRNVTRAIDALKGAQQAQAEARRAAQAAASSIHNGLGLGGLDPNGVTVTYDGNGAATGIDLTSADNITWRGVGSVTQTGKGDGKVQVDIEQNKQQAVLTWKSFNVGRDTTLNFNQGDSSFVALNRVTGGDIAPSQILGAVNAKGSVYVINQNGIVFGGASQVNVHALIASTADMVNTSTIYSSGSAPSFTGAGNGSGSYAGLVRVEAGAEIATAAPASATSGGGFVMLLGKTVENAGAISTPKGQALLAAGDDFIIRPGYSTETNKYSTTRGSEIAPVIGSASTAGTVTNSGIIFARQGDITLAGHAVTQSGVLISTSSVNIRGTVHLLNSASDTSGSILLGAGSVTQILPELDSAETALDSQRDGLIKASDEANRLRAADAPFDNLSLLADRLDQGRIEIVTGGIAVFEGGKNGRDGSLAITQGGQIAVSASKRVFTADGAVLDVSGVTDVLLPMSANQIKVNIQGSEMKDSPVNRDSDSLRNEDVWIDIRDLILVPAGTGGYDSDRYYTKGGLLELSGHLANTKHKIGEWAAIGGTITLSAPEVVAQTGSVFNLSGGMVSYEGGTVHVANVIGADGRVYTINDAPTGMQFVAMGDETVVKHGRWGVVETYRRPFGLGRETTYYDPGYTVGRDAGKLILSTPTSVFEGTILAAAYNGQRQTNARPSGVTDGYKHTQNTAAMAGSLWIGQYGVLGRTGVYDTDIRIGDIENITQTMTALDTLGRDANTVWLNADWLNAAKLGGLELGTSRTITIENGLTLADGGTVNLVAPIIDIKANVTARGGSIGATNRFTPVVGAGTASITRELEIDGKASTTLRNGATLDTRGLWTNAQLDPENLRGLAFINGGNVTLESSRDVTIEKGSLIDVSSGAAILANGRVMGGRGGNVSLLADATQHATSNNGLLTLDGDIRGYGVNGGGKLKLQSGPAIIIGGKGLENDGKLNAGESAPADLVLLEDYVIQAGEVLPVDIRYKKTRALPGETLSGDPQFWNGGLGVELLNDWQVPSYPSSTAPRSIWITYYAPGETTPTSFLWKPRTVSAPLIPAGSRVIGYSSSLPSGYVVPSGVFAGGGIPIEPVTALVKAGEIASMPLTIPANAIIPRGIVLDRVATVMSPGKLDTRIVSTGFSAYDVNGTRGVIVGKDVTLDVTMPVYRLSADAQSVATGTDPSAMLELWTPPLYIENPAAGVLTQRQGASLALLSGGASAGGSIVISDGAAITVDPGQTIRLDGWLGRTIVEGTLNAWGGEIAINQNYKLTTSDPSSDPIAANGGDVNSIWIGDKAVLDVAARAATATDFYGRTYGIVRDGGTIAIGGALDWEKTGSKLASDAFVIIRPGAVLDASGTHAMLDYPVAGLTGSSRSVDVASNGGTIVLASNRGLFIDGAMKAAAGGVGAAGGTLGIALETPIYALDGASSDVMTARELILSQTGGSGLAADLQPNQRDPALLYGHGRIGADQIKAGGFDNAALLVNGVLSFDDGLVLNLAQSLRLYAGVYALSDSAGDGARVSLGAAYVRLAGVSTAASSNDGYVMPMVRFDGGTSKAPSRQSDAVFAVAADLIDIRDRVGFGISAVATSGSGNGNVTIDRRGFGDVSLVSSGDLRLLRSMAGGLQSTGLITRGDISLTAAQLYPVTGASAIIAAGALNTRGSNGDEGWDGERTLTIARTAGTDAKAPLSVFGTLKLAAPTIEQGGVVRAPLGQLTIGFGKSWVASGSIVRFLPGSETSISAAGVTLPYGGTVDGIKYIYDGKEILLKDASGFNSNAVLYQGINIAGQEIDVQKGAWLDLSGGGDLLGGAFVSGRGGSVDVLRTAFVNANPGYSFSDPGNPVYAIVPGYTGYAPYTPDAGASDPMIGRQITIPAGVPGLPAGTYTLMPVTYALMKGAFRVEIGKVNPMLDAVRSIDGLTYVAPGRMSTLGTAQQNALPNAVFLTSAKAVGRYSSYNETNYNAFVLADAARRGVLRAPLTSDAQFLNLVFDEGAGRSGHAALTFAGKALFTPAAKSGGFAGGVTVSMNTIHPFDDAELEIMRAGGTPKGTPGIVGASIDVGALTAIDAPSLSIDGYTSKLILRSGATLSAGEVALLSSNDPATNRIGGGIVVEQGAVIDTIGKGKVGRDADDGYLREVGAALILSNGNLNVQLSGAVGPAIEIGTCADGGCMGETLLVSEGTMALATTGSFQIADTVRYGTRNLVMATSSINFGDGSAIADAAAAGALPPGLTINQSVLNNLLSGNKAINAPAVETLRLNASQSINIYGAVTIDTASAGASGLERLVLGAPAIYGYGAAGDKATISTGEFVWASVVDGTNAVSPGAAIANRLGHGTLDIKAERIVVGYGVNTQPQSTTVADRVVAGFDALNLIASERVLFEGKNRIGVYQAQGGHVADKGFSYSGGALTITAPLITSSAGGSTTVKSGGAIRLVAPEGQASKTDYDALGGELRFVGSDLLVDTAVALHSGKLTLESAGSVTLGARSRIDLSGREIVMFDVKKYSWGGDLSLISDTGDIIQAAGSVIDLSAKNNAGGTLNAVAAGTDAGTVDLAGSILGGASGEHDAGGTMVPFDAAGLSITAQHVTGFAALNERLNTGSVTGARRFHIKQGDLVVGDGVKAHRVEIFTDGGSLTVDGRIDASGFQVGSIRLGGRDGLTINGTLDAHGTGVRRDSYGKVIESPNRAIIDLTSSDGRIAIAGGARFDLRYGGDAQTTLAPLGTLTLNARRLGTDDADVSVAGTPEIRGAKLIAVNAFRTYDDAPLADNADVTGSKPQIVTQAYMDGIDRDSQDFMNAALSNSDLSGRLAGLGVYHLRPGVAIVSNAATNPEGNIAVMGDLDLSGYRYGPNADRDNSLLRGYGEPGALVIRAGGELSIRGSINDGFGLPKDTPDDSKSWVLAGYQGWGGGWDGRNGAVTPFGQEVVIPIDGVVLDAGTKFSAGVTLNYNVPVTGMTLPAGAVLPVEASLAAQINLPAGIVLAANILNSDGSVAYAAGTVLAQGITLDAGMRLGAGTRLLGETQIGAIVWPKGVPLPVAMSLSETLPLAVGSRIPSMTSVKVVGGSLPLRPTVDGRQGRNWAVAPMLGEGSTSWDMRLAAGADLDAVDTRMVRKGASSNLTLADTHAAGTIKEIPGSAVFTDAVADSPVGSLYFPGDTVYDLSVCSSYPGICSISAGTAVFEPERPLMSVVRTGAGDLELIAAGDVRVRSLYGVYTAGVNTVSGGDDTGFNQPRSRFLDGTVLGEANATLEPLLTDYRAWYPDHGGNLLVDAGGTIVGDQIAGDDDAWAGVALYDSAYAGNWLWRQGSGSAIRGAGSVPTAWWINFGTYAVTHKTDDNSQASVVGFTGFGALGGGNVVLRAGGDAGAIDTVGSALAPTSDTAYARSQALVVAVGSTGRIVANGDGVIDAADLLLTGGGDIDVQLGGRWNPNAAAAKYAKKTASQFGETGKLNGALINLRGRVQLNSGAIGTLGLNYGNIYGSSVRFMVDPFTAMLGTPSSGITLTLGDSASYLNTRGDLVLGVAEDPGRVRQFNSAAYSHDGTDYLSGGVSWFSLWTQHSAVNLFSAGGNLTPRQLNMDDVKNMEGQIVYPPILRAVAASGSLYYGLVPETNNWLQDGALVRSLLLAPSASGALELLAGQSIYANGHSVNMSGADVTLPTPFNPAFAAWAPNALGQLYGTLVFSNGTAVGTLDAYKKGTGMSTDSGVLANSGDEFPLFAFGPPGVLNGMVGEGRDPAHFYAVNGDIVSFGTGEKLAFYTGVTWYEGGGPVRIRAGRDILGLGRASDESRTIKFGLNSASATGSLIVHGGLNDVSVISAGRDIRYANVEIAGPGALEISAGRNIIQEDRGQITSIGPVVRGDRRPGADIAVAAGVGADGLDYGAIRDSYLDPAKLADPNYPLVHANNQGKVAKVYGKELVLWLGEHYGFTGSTDEALAYFDALPVENRNIFLRQVYFAELKAGGREYNDASSSRYGNYVRGRLAIAALFPDNDKDGKPIRYVGDISMFSTEYYWKDEYGSGKLVRTIKDGSVRTLFGGDIQMLTPGGRQVIGVEGVVPGANAGLVTQGTGNIQLYSKGDILLGLSRIMTTYGGGILAWSATGDINAGRGAKTTVVYTPAKRVYDAYGNVSLSPTVPSAGAGIATLNPIPEVKPGDVDLIAPLGTVDAGEAGIRVSGDINVAALHIVNAANIQVQGNSMGLPVAVAPNVGAMNAASNTAGQASGAAEAAARASRQTGPRTDMPSIITVEVIGYGGGDAQSGQGRQQRQEEQQRRLREQHSYNANSEVQFVGLGKLTGNERRELTERETRNLKGQD